MTSTVKIACAVLAAFGTFGPEVLARPETRAGPSDAFSARMDAGRAGAAARGTSPENAAKTEAGHATAAEASAAGRMANLGNLFATLYRAEEERLALAEVAGTNGGSPAVRTLAASLIHTGESTVTDVLAIARTHGFGEARLRELFAFTENHSDREEREADWARLARNGGPDFDAAACAIAARTLNREIAVARIALDAGVDNEVKTFLERLIPRLEASAREVERVVERPAQR